MAVGLPIFSSSVLTTVSARMMINLPKTRQYNKINTMTTTSHRLFCTKLHVNLSMTATVFLPTVLPLTRAFNWVASIACKKCSPSDMMMRYLSSAELLPGVTCLMDKNCTVCPAAKSSSSPASALCSLRQIPAESWDIFLGCGGQDPTRATRL